MKLTLVKSEMPEWNKHRILWFQELAAEVKEFGFNGETIVHSTDLELALDIFKDRVGSLAHFAFERKWVNRN